MINVYEVIDNNYNFPTYLYYNIYLCDIYLYEIYISHL